MTASILLTCDRDVGGEGTCARRIVLAARTIDEARAQAARQGWTSNGFGDICPYHPR